MSIPITAANVLKKLDERCKIATHALSIAPNATYSKVKCYKCNKLFVPGVKDDITICYNCQPQGNNSRTHGFGRCGDDKRIIAFPFKSGQKLF